MLVSSVLSLSQCSGSFTVFVLVFVMFLYCIIYCHVFGVVMSLVHPLTLCIRILKLFGCGRLKFAEIMMLVIFRCKTFSLTVGTATCILM